MAGLPRVNAKNLQQMLGMERGVAVALAKVLKGTEDCNDVREVDKALDAVEAAMRREKGGGTFGTEPIRDPDAGFHGYWGDTVALYVNTGDTYNTTVVYDVGRDLFYVTSWGDWLEAYERRIGRPVA